MEQLKHGQCGRIASGMLMQRESPTLQSQLLAEISFISKFMIPGRTCVWASLSDSLPFLREYFHGTVVFYGIKQCWVGGGEYDPVHPYMDVSVDLVARARRLFSRVLLICDGETDERQAHLLRCVDPFCALMQVQPPYPLGVPGYLFFPAGGSWECGLLYAECALRFPMQTLISEMLHAEVFAFQLCTRGPNAAQYDAKKISEIVRMGREQDLFNDFIKRLCS